MQHTINQGHAHTSAATELRRKEQKRSTGLPSREGRRNSITKLGLLINKEIKDILIKDIFPFLSNTSAAAKHIIFKR
jgi:hypothetical protein